MEKKTEHDMETRILQCLIGLKNVGGRGALYHPVLEGSGGKQMLDGVAG